MIGNRPDLIERGTIIQVDLKARAGSVQSGERPAIVVSRTAMTAGSTVMVIPFTTTPPMPGDRGKPYVVVLVPDETGLPMESTAIVHQMQPIDKRFILNRKRGFVVPAAMARIDAAIRLVVLPAA